jgi:hypothetical protein
LEQPIAVKCFLCGGAASFTYAYARLSDNEEFLGVIYRGVCRECLADYIERVKDDRHVRADGWVWLLATLPVGGLLAALTDNIVWRMIGYGLILLAILLPLGSRLLQRHEAKRARIASDAENETRYSARMCLEDAFRTNHLIKLVPLHERYLSPDYTPERISAETGVSRAMAEQLSSISAAALVRMRAADHGSGASDVFDNTISV